MLCKKIVFHLIYLRIGMLYTYFTAFLPQQRNVHHTTLRSTAWWNPFQPSCSLTVTSWFWAAFWMAAHSLPHSVSFCPLIKNKMQGCSHKVRREIKRNTWMPFRLCKQKSSNQASSWNWNGKVVKGTVVCFFQCSHLPVFGTSVPLPTCPYSLL